MSEIWSLEVKIGSRWESRKVTFSREAMLIQFDLYVSRALRTNYEARIVPYVIDESRAEEISI